MRPGQDEREDLLTRLALLRTQGSVPASELDEMDQAKTDAIEAGLSNPIMGTTKPLSSMAQRIKDAAAKSDVKWVPTAEQAMDDAIKQKYKDAPKNFFEKYGPKEMEVQGQTIDKQEAERLKEVFAKIKEMVKKDGR